MSIPRGDILVLAGNSLFHDRGSLPIPPCRGYVDGRTLLADLDEWAHDLHHAGVVGSIVLVGGPHDRILEEVGSIQAQKLMPHVQYLCDSAMGISLNGRLVVIYGSPVSHTLSLSSSLDRAFHVSSQQDFERYLDAIPPVVDILILPGAAASPHLKRTGNASLVLGDGSLSRQPNPAHHNAVGASISSLTHLPSRHPLVIDVLLPDPPTP